MSLYLPCMVAKDKNKSSTMNKSRIQRGTERFCLLGHGFFFVISGQAYDN